MTKNTILDIENEKKEFDKLDERFRLLSKRFQAIAMDYKYYIKSDVSDFEIYKLRDNVIFRMHSARFHFELLLMYHNHVERRFAELYKSDIADVWRDGIKTTLLHKQCTEEAYSIFDSLMYHLTSTFDYLFRLINFTYGKEMANQPKWNLFKTKRNLRDFVFCSKEIIPDLEIIDADFAYPLLQHRSHLIHTENDMGDFRLDVNSAGTTFNVKFFATKLFKENFPQLEKDHPNTDFTIKYASIWLMDKTIKSLTEVLFDLSEDLKRNKKPQPYVSAYLADDGTMHSPSIAFWGDRSVT